MPVPWLAIFKAIPWGDVVVTAPKVLDQAKKLVATLRKSESRSAVGAQTPAAAQTQDDSLQTIMARLTNVEGKLEEMTREALSSAELARALAEQNAQLVQAVEILGSRVRRLSVLVVALIGVVAAIVLWQLVLR